MTKEKKRIFASLAITLGIIVLFYILYQIPGIKTACEILELKTLDLRFIREPQPPRSDKIVHIDIDDESIRKIGWPCPRKYYAYLVDILTECGSEAVIFDILFLEPSQASIDKKMISSKLKGEIKERFKETGEDTEKISRIVSEGASSEDITACLSQLKDGLDDRCSIILEGLDEAILDPDELIARAVRRGRNVFIPFYFPEKEQKRKPTAREEALLRENFSLSATYKETRKEKGHYKSEIVSIPVDVFFENISNSGFVNAGSASSLDRDGVMRRIPLVWEYKDGFYPQLAFSGYLALAYGKGHGIEIVPGKHIRITGTADNTAGKEVIIPVDEKLHMIVHWAGKWAEDFRHIPFIGFVELKQVRDLLEENLMILDDKYTAGRLKKLKAALRSGNSPSPQLLKEIESAEADIFECLQRNIKKIPPAEPMRKELEEEYETITLQRQQKKEIMEKITRFVRGKICIVGLAGTGTHDRRPIPIQPDYPMVGLHSNVLNTLLMQNFIRNASPALNIIIFLAAGLAISSITPLFSPWKGMGASLMLLGVFAGVAQFLFQKNGLVINMVGPMGLIISSYIAITSYRYVSEEKEKKWVRKAFSHYLSPKVMDEILADPSKLGLGGKRQELTVLFSDIRGFTSYCEKRSPEEIIPILNEYLDVMSNVILKYDGTLDKYVGDEIVAFYGAPAMKKPMNHAEMAVRTALEMFEELKKLQEKWKQEGKEPLDFGVGINTGQMMVGNMGSTNRLDYTVIGDEVNLGARVEALTRDYNVRIIITQSTYDKVKDIVEVKKLGETMVKGKAQPVTVYELISIKG